MKARLMLIHALSPVHAGTGQSAGGIDLPIAREKPTNIPLVPGSTVKGVLRASTSNNGQLHAAVFGPDTEHASDNAGSVQFSDANLVFLPVRSLRGTFGWATSRYMLQRLARDARECSLDFGPLPPEPGEDEAMVAGTRLQAKGPDGKDQIVFEDLVFSARSDDGFGAFVSAFAERLFDEEERQQFVDRACMVHENAMAFLLETSTEVTTRICLNPEKKTVVTGALWTEEALPVESLLAGLVVATPVKQKNGSVPDSTAMLEYVAGLAEGGALQLGGKASVGRGLCRMRIVEGK